MAIVSVVSVHKQQNFMLRNNEVFLNIYYIFKRNESKRNRIRKLLWIQSLDLFAAGFASKSKWTKLKYWKLRACSLSEAHIS